MDIRSYIKVKKAPGNTMDECEFHNGVMFTKNIAHKHMRATIECGGWRGAQAVHLRVDRLTPASPRARVCVCG